MCTFSRSFHAKVLTSAAAGFRGIRTHSAASLAHEMFADGVEPPLSDPLQLMKATVLERDLRACDEIFDGARDEDLAGLCLRRDACSERNGNSARLFPHQLALAGV